MKIVKVSFLALTLSLMSFTVVNNTKEVSVVSTDSKGIVWAHNTHVGDYKATDMMTSGHVNIGGLAREIYGEENVGLVGFGSYSGTVTASYMWNGPILKFDVPEAKAGTGAPRNVELSDNA